MRLLSDVERLMAARMAVRSEARGSEGATTKVGEGLHVLGPLERDTRRSLS